MEKTNSQIHHPSTQCIVFYHNWLRDEQGTKRGFENTCSVLRYRVDFFEKDECCRLLSYFTSSVNFTFVGFVPLSDVLLNLDRLNVSVFASFLASERWALYFIFASLFQSEAKCGIVLMWMKTDIHNKDSPWNRGSSELQKGLIPILIYDDCTNQSVPLCITIDQIH